MSSTLLQSSCVKCHSEDAVLKCAGCSESFCYSGYGIHRRELNEQLDEIEKKRTVFQEALGELVSHPQDLAELEKIDRWEKEAMMKIKLAANEAREGFLNFFSSQTHGIRIQLKHLSERLKQANEENDFIETHLQMWNKQLEELQAKLTKLLNTEVKYSSTNIMTYIVVNTPLLPAIPNIDANVKWMQKGSCVAGGNEKGNRLNQLSDPTGVYVTDDQTVYVADCSNHRIVEWKKDKTFGRVVAGGNGSGDQNDQLNNPSNVFFDEDSDCLFICDFGNRRVVRWPVRNRKIGTTIISNIDCWDITMDINGSLYVSDISKNEVRRYRRDDNIGTVVAGGNGQGNRLDQFHGPYYICVDHDLSVYVSDHFNHRVMKWTNYASEGIVVAGRELSGPYGIAVDQAGRVYVTQWKNHRVTRWSKEETEGTVLVEGNEEGEEDNQFKHPCGLAIGSQNNLFVVDYSNCRVQKFDIETS